MNYARFGLAAIAVGLGSFTLLGTLPPSGLGQVANPDLVGGNNRFGGSVPLHSQVVLDQSNNDVQLLLSGEAACERDVANLLSEYSRSDEKKRAELKGKINGLLDQQFEHQQKRRNLEVTRIEAQLTKLRELIKKRADARPTIVQKRLDQLLSEADGLGWTPPQGNRNAFNYNVPMIGNGMAPIPRP